MVIKIPAFETLENINRYMKSSSKPSLGCSACSPARDIAAAVFPPLGLDAMTQSARSGEGTARSLSAALGVRREYLNLK